MIATNALIYGALHLAGHGWVYSAWVVAFITPFPLFTRIRSIAEHSCLPEVADVLQNTRTTRAGLLARLTVAPNYVNYHVEHHLAPGIPCYHLTEAHQLLREREAIPTAPGYLEVLRLAGLSL